MFRLVVSLCVASLLSSSVNAFDFDVANSDESPLGRLLFLGGNGQSFAGFNANVTSALAFMAALASALTSLFTLVGLGILLASNMDNDKGGYGGTGGHSTGYGSTGSSDYRRMLDPFAINWETLSLVDWISMMQDTWQGFDPTDIECQKKLICEVHQNTAELGPVASALSHYFSYLQFSKVMSLPESVKMVISEYLEAADQGRTEQRECDNIFVHCPFSVRKIIHKYSPLYKMKHTKTSGDTNSIW